MDADSPGRALPIVRLLIIYPSTPRSSFAQMTHFFHSFSRIGYESPLSPAGSYVTTITMLKSSFLASLHFTRACYSFVVLYGLSVESASGSSRIQIVRHIQANGETKSVTIALRGGLPSARSARVCLVNSNRMVAGMRAMYEETTFGKEGEKSLEGLSIWAIMGVAYRRLRLTYE